MSNTRVGILAVLSLTVLLSAPPARAQDAPLQATVVSVTGTVEVKTAGEQAWRPAAVDMTLAEGTTISTGVKSKVALDFAGHAMVTISRPSIVTVSRFLLQQGQVQTVLQLQVGSMKAGVKKERIRSDFRVIMPAVTLSVRGTEIAEITYSEMGAKVCMGTEGLLDMTKYDEDMNGKTRQLPALCCLSSERFLQLVDSKKRRRTWRTRWYGRTEEESDAQNNDPTDPESPPFELIREGGQPENGRTSFQCTSCFETRIPGNQDDYYPPGRIAQ